MSSKTFETFRRLFMTRQDLNQMRNAEPVKGRSDSFSLKNRQHSDIENENAIPLNISHQSSHSKHNSLTSITHISTSLPTAELPPIRDPKTKNLMKNLQLKRNLNSSTNSSLSKNSDLDKNDLNDSSAGVRTVRNSSANAIPTPRSADNSVRVQRSSSSSVLEKRLKFYF